MSRNSGRMVVICESFIESLETLREEYAECLPDIEDGYDYAEEAAFIQGIERAIDKIKEIRDNGSV